MYKLVIDEGLSYGCITLDEPENLLRFRLFNPPHKMLEKIPAANEREDIAMYLAKKARKLQKKNKKKIKFELGAWELKALYHILLCMKDEHEKAFQDAIDETKYEDMEQSDWFCETREQYEALENLFKQSTSQGFNPFSI